jgi:hypothetical protein
MIPRLLVKKNEWVNFKPSMDDYLFVTWAINQANLGRRRLAYIHYWSPKDGFVLEIKKKGNPDNDSNRTRS